MDTCKTLIQRQAGFSLIEVMIVVAIVAILGSIALPSYTSYITRGKITDVVSILADYRIRMEQYYQDNRNYGTAGVGVACPVAAAASKYATFTCTIVGNPSTSYTVTATSIAQSLGAATGDYTFTINEANAKGTTKFKGTAYGAGVKACWLVGGSEC